MRPAACLYQPNLPDSYRRCGKPATSGEGGILCPAHRALKTGRAAPAAQLDWAQIEKIPAPIERHLAIAGYLWARHHALADMATALEQAWRDVRRERAPLPPPLYDSREVRAIVRSWGIEIPYRRGTDPCPRCGCANAWPELHRHPSKAEKAAIAAPPAMGSGALCRWCGAFSVEDDGVLCAGCQDHAAELAAIDQAERRGVAAATYGPLFADLYNEGVL